MPVDLPGAIVLRLDITDPEPVAAAAPDVTLLVDNAGVDTVTGLVTGEWSATVKASLAGDPADFYR